MKKVLCFFLMFSLCVGICPSGAVFANAVYSGYCGAEGDGTNVSWTFDPSTGTLTFSGSGAMRDWRHETEFDYLYEHTTGEIVEYVYTPWYSYRNQILHGVISDGITVMGNFTFSGCNNLKDVFLSNDLTNIGVGGFESCHSLTEVDIPDQVTFVGVGAFYSAITLSSVSLPEGLEIIYHGAFGACESLTELVIPSTVTAIKDAAFAQCSGLTSVVIPEGVSAIESYVFYYCTSLTAVKVLGEIRQIDANAFYKCSKLESFKIPETCTSVGEDAFGSCKRLTLECYAGSYGETYCKEHYAADGYQVISHNFRVYKVVEPTCTEGGYTLLYCEECERYREDTPVESTGHSMGDWSVSKVATSQSEGELVCTCVSCGEKSYKTYPYHKPGDTDLDEKLTIYDVVLMLQYLSGITEFDEYAMSAGDLNLNLVIDAQDSVLLLQRICGFDTVFPSERSFSE